MVFSLETVIPPLYPAIFCLLTLVFHFLSCPHPTGPHPAALFQTLHVLTPSFPAPETRSHISLLCVFACTTHSARDVSPILCLENFYSAFKSVFWQPLFHEASLVSPPLSPPLNKHLH
jgi:hypothetical protein